MIKKNISFFVIIFFYIFNIYAQNPEKYFIRNAQENGTLYFIRPVKYNSLNSGYKLIPDYTFTKEKNRFDSIKMNFSIYSEKPLLTIDSIILFSTEGNIATLVDGEKFFTQKEKKSWHNRFSFYIEFTDFRKYILSDKNQLIIYTDNKEIIHTISGKKKQYFKVLNDMFYELEFN